jgi:hypothetical protein
MGKLRLFGYDWTARFASINGASFNWMTKNILFNRESESWLGQYLLHELLEMSMQEAGVRYFKSCDGDPHFFLNHRDMDNIAKLLYTCLADNGLISEKKIRKLIEEK